MHVSNSYSIHITMNHIISKYLLILLELSLLTCSLGDTYSVKVQTDQHVNLVDKRFLSFTVDPKFLFLNSDKYAESKESICMASSLYPAYIRIAGPSTSQLVFKNNVISFTNLTKEREKDSENFQKDTISSDQKDDIHLEKDFNVTDDVKLNLESNEKVSNQGENLQSYESQELAVTYSQWNKFLKWTQNVGFDLVFALNNEEKTSSGLWDPNTVLDILTVAKKANVAEMYWQLGYECTNQTIEEYLNDLETLRVIVETFEDQANWKVVGGDVTKCLAAESKSDFKDYITLSDELFDAVLLNGNSSAYELERMSESDRLKLLQSLSDSTTPLWLTESPHLYENIPHSEESISPFEETKSHHRRGRKWKTIRKLEARRTRSNKVVEKDDNNEKYKELFRAADWMTSLGYSAKNGFSVHFRELTEQEIYEPTLSFYMALLYKNLVGERVLNVEMEASRAVLFAHCTSLGHKPVEGAVTLYGANLDDEPARFSVKLSKREEGGDVMQFVLSYDADGKIIVNGRPMHYEGDMRPAVRRLRPYKTLLIHLPPTSFGFWVLANTNIEACQNVDIDDASEHSVEVITATDNDHEIIDEHTLVGNTDDDEHKITENIHSNEDTKENTLKTGLENLKIDLNNVHSLLQAKSNELNRKKRGINDNIDNIKEKLRYKLKNKRNIIDKHDKKKPRFEIIRRLFGLPKLNGTKHFQVDRPRVFTKLDKNKSVIAKRFVKPKVKQEETNYEDNAVRRKRRSIAKEPKKTKEDIEESSENEIDISDDDKMKLWKILKEIHEQLKDLPEKDSKDENNIESGSLDYMDEEIQSIIEEPKSSDVRMRNMIKHKTKQGILKSTVENVMGVLKDLNRNLNKFWSAISLLD